MPDRPRKPWYRLRNIMFVFLALLLLAAAGFGVELYRALTATPGPIPNVVARYEQLIARYRPGGSIEPNAWPYLTETVELYRSTLSPDGRPYIEHEGQEVPVDLSVLAGADDEDRISQISVPEPVARAVAEAAVARLDASGLYDRLAALATMRHSVRPAQEGPAIGWILPEIGAARGFARINIIRMRRAHDEGADADIVAPFEQSLAVARHLANQVSLIDHVEACGIVQRATRELRHELTARAMPAPVLRDLLAAMDRQLPLPPLEVGIEGNRLMTLDVIHRVHTAGGRVIVPAQVELMSDPLFGPADPPGRLSNLRSITMARKAESIRLCDEFHDDAVRRSRLRRAEQFEEHSKLAEVDAVIESSRNRYIVLGSLLPALGKPYSDRGNAEVAIAGTRLMLAIELFRAERGALPARLEDLVADYLPELPQDQWAPDGFRYRTTDSGYILYSVGADLTDDGGEPHPDSPLRSFHPTGKGYDYVLNQPRRPLADQIVFPEE